jgi:hypothetical protein
VPNTEATTTRGVARHRCLALLQGASYLWFGGWSLLARRHYRRTHAIKSDDWVLSAHGAWLVVVGSTLGLAALRGSSGQAELRLLGIGAALGLALNDATRIRRLAPIYRLDLVYELGLLGGWLNPAGRGESAAVRGGHARAS